MAAAAGALLPGDGIVIAGKLYSGVALTLDTCLLPHESAHCSPSRVHGLSARTEERLRNRMCEMIQSAGILLRLPQVAMATAQILFHRFFYCKSFVRHCAETVAMACLQLASKIEEEPRRVRDVLNVFQHLKDAAGDRRRGPMLLDDGYVSRKSDVIKAERRVLKELGFCVHVKHPHKVFLSRNWCRFMMGIWVWLRSANVWSTFFLSAFHFQTLRRVAPPVTNIHGHPGPPRSLIFGLCLIWSLNLIYSIPAFIFSKNGDKNSTEVSPTLS
uniref:Cyclin-like domain-containing protein n=1 Tax=Sinocyclocheilus rhinocerous TaxID=307959 RepID=A0A673NB29_9TELE